MWSVGSWGVALRLQPAEARRGQLVGLLGDVDGDGANDFRARNGAQFDAAALCAAARPPSSGCTASSGSRGASAQAESLFDYGPGETTATFTKRDFPARFFTVGNLTPPSGSGPRPAAVRPRRDRSRGARGLHPRPGRDRRRCVRRGRRRRGGRGLPGDRLADRDRPGAHRPSAPVALAPTPDGTLHVAAATTPHARLPAAPGSTRSTSLGADDAQGPVTLLEPMHRLRPAVLAAGAAGSRSARLRRSLARRRRRRERAHAASCAGRSRPRAARPTSCRPRSAPRSPTRRRPTGRHGPSRATRPAAITPSGAARARPRRPTS